MTNIYTYCLFDKDDNFLAVYSSLKSAYRDALSISNRGNFGVRMLTPDGWSEPSLKDLRNTLKGVVDIAILFKSDQAGAKIIKTKLKE
tara:strand:- start:4287 stop:4550 length:264 start_codon:yes stop_codon:yes gene_type:complete